MGQKYISKKLLLNLSISIWLGMSIYLNSHQAKENSNHPNNYSTKLSFIMEEKQPACGFESTKNDNIYSSQPKLGKIVPLTGNLQQMNYFFNALKKSKSNKVRIAHYGDSLLMGDIITEYLRNHLQENFSGKGIGYLSINADDYRMKRTIHQSYSDDWNYYSFITRNPEQLQFGINGTLAIPKQNSWVKYETTQVFKAINSFNIIRVFYSNADKSTQIQYQIDHGNFIKVNLEPGNNVNELTIPANNSTSFYLQFLSGTSPSMYGVSLESMNGVYVDNFAMRGNSGASLQELSPKTLQEFNGRLSYDLIILNYGANVSSPNKGVYSVYENKMVNIIEEFKKSFPKTSFLIVSTADKTVKKGTQFVTNPDIPLLLEAQKRIAERTGVAFWNLWEAMGGSNSMNEWVNAAPPQALRDYSHFTYQGGERVGELLFNAIMEAYRKF